MGLFGLGLNPIQDVSKVFNGAVNAGNNVLGINNAPSGLSNFNTNAQTIATGNFNGTPTNSNTSSGNTAVLGTKTGTPTGTLNSLGLNTGTSSTPAYSTYQQSVLNNLQPSLDVLHNSTDAASATAARDYGQGVLNFITQQQLGQNAINSSSVQNELSRNQGSKGVLDMVGQGIRSGGVVLGNANAGSSSASEALARAYGMLGRTQQTGINNQYAQGLNSIGNQQTNFGLQQNAGVKQLGVTKADAIDAIVQNANTQLQYLQNQLVGASLPDRIDIQNQQQQIRDAAASQLAVHDPEISQGLSGVAPTSVDANRLQAQQLATAGTAPDAQFNYTSSLPPQFQDTGPFSSSLPVFANPTSKKVTA